MKLSIDKQKYNAVIIGRTINSVGHDLEIFINGGKIIATDTPKAIAECSANFTG